MNDDMKLEEVEGAVLREADARRFAELGRMMNEMLRNMSPAEKDRMMQRHLAEAMRPEQKFKALGGMMNFVIDQLRMRKACDEQQMKNGELGIANRNNR
ncbi:MAG: hypothetical protein IPK83_20170 [Planctomycetes bacterium]|nr:hypothetical protein [Planctomycetota bacterium]